MDDIFCLVHDLGHLKKSEWVVAGTVLPAYKSSKFEAPLRGLF